MSVSLCILRIEIDEELDMDNQQKHLDGTKKDIKQKERGKRESKSITIETYPNAMSEPEGELTLLPQPTSSRKSSPSESGNTEDTISFFFGNPLVEVTKGILHLYKENEMKEAQDAKILCLLSVPGTLGARDLLAFAASFHEDIAHVRILRDGSADHYMALLTFRRSSAALQFYSMFEGAAYSSLAPECSCRIARVSRVDAAVGDAPPNAFATELPTCPVCLERMDESVAGVLSVQCAHSFHAQCLLRWGLASCPVCRCAQTPEPSGHSHCQECHEEAEQSELDESETRDHSSGVAEGLLDEADTGALWICLICGHVGCSRYERGHAAKHFMSSNHTYAMQLGSNRVWDYAGDRFVHRLVQNKVDGKLVASGAERDKDDAAAADYQRALDAHDQLHVEHVDRLKAEHQSECDQLRKRATEAESKAQELAQQVMTLEKENKALEKKLANLTHKLGCVQSELSEERGLSKAMADNQAEWQQRAKASEDRFLQEVSELKEQLRDVMFFVEARDKLSASTEQHELEHATVHVPTHASTHKHRRRRR